MTRAHHRPIHCGVAIPYIDKATPIRCCSNWPARTRQTQHPVFPHPSGRDNRRV